MKKLLPIILLLFVLSIPLVQAEEITFSVDQQEYYFLTGQQAMVPLTINNTYDHDKSGTLSYSMTQRIQQGGSTYTSTNAQSQPFTAEKGNNTIQINFGRSDQPLQLTVDLEFLFQHDNKDHMVFLDDLIIYFVSNQSQMNNQQNPQQSTSEEIKNAEPNNNNQQQQPQTPQQKLQNNQMSQDSQALKKQIQQQLAEEQRQQQQFEENLFNNTDFQQHHQEILNQNYTLKDKQLNAESNDTGSFNFTYENEQGEQATLQGRMDNGSLQQVQKQTAEKRQQLLETLNQSTMFQEYQQHLFNEGYNQTDTRFSQHGNQTTITLSYENEQNETATITAEFVDEDLKKVTLEKQEAIPLLFWMLPVFIFIFFIVLFLIYRIRKKRQQKTVMPAITQRQIFDYKKEAKRLLAEAERLYHKQNYKEAYAKAGQSLRLYLSYEHGLNKEITNQDVIHFLKNKDYPYHAIKNCFDLCSLVEFAKYQANDTDFHQIKNIVGKTIQ